MTSREYLKRRERHLLNKYGITLSDYDKMLKKQKNKCPICLRNSKELPRPLAVDHDHVTGEIRGLLCNYCNHRVVGRHRDWERMRRVYLYLKKGTGLFVPEKNKKRKRGGRKKKC